MTTDSYIPGRLTMDQAVELAKLAKGKTVLQIGAYCGRATVALAATAERVWLLDDFAGYPGHVRETVGMECDKNVTDAGFGEKVELVFGNTDDPALAAPLPAFDMAYIDADRDEDTIVTDIAFVRRALKDDSLLVFHEQLPTRNERSLVVQRIEKGYCVGAT